MFSYIEMLEIFIKETLFRGIKFHIVQFYKPRKIIKYSKWRRQFSQYSLNFRRILITSVSNSLLVKPFVLRHIILWSQLYKKLDGHIAFGLCVSPSHFLVHAISYEPCRLGF